MRPGVSLFFRARTVLSGLGLLACWFTFGPSTSPEPLAQEPKQQPSVQEVQGWTQGKGWGWVWGPDDEVGSLNAMTDASRAAAMALAHRGEVFDLGLNFSRQSFKWPGHNPTEVMTFRSPDRIASMKDPDAPPDAINTDRVFWHSCALFISDNVGTQIDGLGHIAVGADHHWYNGFKTSEWGGDFGIRKCDASTIPPIIARGVLIDVAAYKRVEALAGQTVITAQDLQETLAWQGVELQVGDVVLVRTGTGRFWGEDGADHDRIAEHDSAGPDLEATRWLVEQRGAMMVGSDTSGYEVSPPPDPLATGAVIPVHKYLLVEQGVHIAEFHYLEDLSAAKIYEFCYIAATNKIQGTTAGFALRPIAVR
ncbi:cyclase family protein [soil metagenome]